MTMGRPTKPVAEKKIRDSTYYDPMIYEWLQAKIEANGGTISSVVNKELEKIMKKEKDDSK